MFLLYFRRRADSNCKACINIIAVDGDQHKGRWSGWLSKLVMG